LELRAKVSFTGTPELVGKERSVTDINVTENREAFVEQILGRMSVEQKIGQCVVVGMSGTVITNDLREAITRYHCSGVRVSPFYRIFRYFSDERAKGQDLGSDYVPSLQKIAKSGEPPYASPSQYVETLNELRELAARRNPAVPLHIVIDQEGDSSKDYSRGGVVQFPSNLGIAASGNPKLAYDVARALGLQMKAAGLDMIHSPVVDVNINPDNPEIGRRAFGDDPKRVAEYAVAMMEGFKEMGVVAAAKHFPGRGDSATDAHHACPKLDVSTDRLHRVELAPYKELISAGIDAIMVAHCMYPRLDGETISTVSRRIVTDLLRKELGFEGIITTDSMTMGALIDRYGVGESCARALAAGADIILMKAENQWRGEMFYTIRKWVEEGRIDEAELDAKVRRVLGMKYDYGLFETMGMAEPERADEPFSDPVVLQTSRSAARTALLVPKDELGVLPLQKRGKVLLVNQLNSVKSPNDRWDHPALFSELLEEEWPQLQTYETEFGGNEEDDEKVVDFVGRGDWDLIICTNFYDRSAAPNRYAKTLVDKGYPVLLITNTPYTIKESGGLLKNAPTIVLNLNLTPEGLRATRDLLFGRIEAQGRWPLSSYNPFEIEEAGQ
jgi:beta-N-acetylhexosaminidase